MAVRLVTASTTVSGSSGNCRAVQAYNLSSDPTSSSLYYDDLGTQRTSGQFTIPNLRVVSGVGIWYRTGTRAGYYNIKLQKGGVDVAGATASLQVTTTNFPAGYGFATIQFGTPATGDGSTNYTLVARCTTATAFGGSAQNTSIYWMRDSTASNWSYVTYDDSDATTAISSGDTVVVDKGVVLTVDANTTLAPVATNKPALWLGDGADLSVPNPASAITIDLGSGNIDYSSNSEVNVGSAVTEVAAGGNVTFTTSIAAASGVCLLRSHYVLLDSNDASCITAGSSIPVDKKWQWYGATSEDHRQPLGAATGGSNVSGQAKVTIAGAIPASFAVNDDIQLMAKKIFGSDTGTGSAYYKISSIDAPNKTITLNANLNYNLEENGGLLINITEASRNLGIKINSTNAILFGLQGVGGSETIDTLIMKGVYAIKCAPSFPRIAGVATTSQVDGYLASFDGTAPIACGFYVQPSSAVGPTMTFNNIQVVSRSSTAGAFFTIRGYNMTISKVAFQGYGGTTTSDVQSASGCTFSDILACNSPGVSGYHSLIWSGFGNTITNLYSIGAALNFYGCGNFTINGGKAALTGANTTYQTSFWNVANLDFSNFTFGDSASYRASASFGYNGFGQAAGFVAVKCSNCTFSGVGVEISTALTMQSGSYFQIHNYNAVEGDHRTYKNTGLFYSPSPYTTLAESVLSSTAALSHNYGLLTQTVASKEFYLVVTGQIAATYYGGTSSVPEVDIYTDDDFTTPSDTLSLTNTTGAQTVAQSFTPVSSNKQCRLTFNTLSDAPKYGSVTFTAATDVVNWTSHGLSANDPVIFQLTSTSSAPSLPTVASGSFLPNVIYYVKTVSSADAFTLSDTAGGTTKDLTSAGTFTTCTCYAFRALCEWSSPKVVHRTYGNTFTSLSLSSFTETLTYPIGTLTTPVANPYITEANSATVAGYTEFTIDHSAQTITITADTTMAKLYDYTQYDLGLTANLGYDEWFTTLDGVNFVSAYDIILNTGVDLTGGGSVEMETGTTFTRTGTATYDGYVINADTTRTVHIKLNGLVASSVVQIYNTTNSAEIDKTTVTGTTYDYYYTYSADKNIRIRVRNVIGTTGYIPYEATGTITNTGFTLNVSQEAAAVYNDNNLDGSTPTEFSLTEGVIKVYIDDPDNITTFQRLYNWYLYSISTETYIDDQTDLITANSTRDYIFDDTLAIKNLDGSNPLYIYGANVRNESSDNAIIDATGGSIFIRGDYPAASVGEIWGDATSYSSGTKGQQLKDASKAKLLL